MPPAILYRATTNSVEEVIVKGLPLGGFATFPYQVEEREILSGDTLVLMSDGLPERFNHKDEILDYPVARKLIEEVAHQPPQAIIEHLIKGGDEWANGRPQGDDVTFVVVKVKAEGLS
jgi:serine phosphatase RsbU (regulator of sigma subunit)